MNGGGVREGTSAIGGGVSGGVGVNGGGDPPGPVFRVLDAEKRYVVGSTPSRRWFGARTSRTLTALDGVRLEIREGESVALVGESGSGKSTLVRTMLGLEALSDGKVLFRQTDLQGLTSAQRKVLARDVAFIYQDARGSMNPRLRIGSVVAEPMLLHGLCSAAEAPTRVLALLRRVGLPGWLADRYPAELSGGQVRRVAVARALASEPKVIFADEAVAGLDVSVQAQLLNLLRDLCREIGLTLVFVTHDLGVASYLCDRIAVMYLGRIVEEGPTTRILSSPRHPYTHALMAAFPSFGRPLQASVRGEIPSPVDLPPGCRFAGRCVQAQPSCRDIDPALIDHADGSRVACLFPLVQEMS